MRIGIVAVDGGFGSGLAVLLDLFAVAEVVRPQVDPSIPAFTVNVLAATPQVTSRTGLTRVADAGLGELGEHDVVVLAALGALDADEVTVALGAPQVRAAITALEGVDPTRTRVAAACTGTFALGDAGLLDGGRATTSWWLSPTFRRRYPRVELAEDVMVVNGPRAVTAGAAFAHVDLALALLAEVSPLLADQVARLLVVDRRSAQSAYLAVDHLARHDPLVQTFEQHVRAQLHEPFELVAVARSLGTTPRTLQRHVRDAVGVTPVALVQRLRVERALHLLRTTDEGLERIAPRVGYAHASTLRTLLRRHRQPAA